jgi:hypothetical protein
MNKRLWAGLSLAVLAGTTAVLWAPWASSTPGGTSACGTTYAPVLDPAHFVSVIDNPYFPLPVGRRLVYTGTKDGQSQTDTVTVTDQTKVILGITTRVVHDVATHDGTVLEKTFDYYAQDDLGNVWYLGEDTTHFLPNGKADTSGSFIAGVGGASRHHHGGQPADPRRLPAGVLRRRGGGHRVGRGDRGFVEGPYGNVRNVLTTLEATRVEAGAYDEKVYGPGIGIVSERSLTGPAEIAQLVSVSG